MQQDHSTARTNNTRGLELKSLLPKELAGHFFGVGSLGELDPSKAVEYVKNLKLPYAYSITHLPEEDMIRQFGVLADGFEEEGDFILNVDIHAFREMVEDSEPLMLDKQHGHSYYLLNDGTHYPLFKTQQTAPATMCFSIRNTSGKQHINRTMFLYFQKLMQRIAVGQTLFLSEFCGTIILCQDDPSLGFVTEMAMADSSLGLTLKDIFHRTDSIYPENVIPAFHYCYDWRQMNLDGWFPLWESKPKLVHIDLVRFPPEVNLEQAEKMNGFMKNGGGLALGVLPNVDDMYNKSILDTLKENLKHDLDLLQKSGVSLDLLKRNTMVSTQCGLSGASPELSQSIHLESSKFQDVFFQVLEK